MSATMSRDFASLLDDLLKAAPSAEDSGARPRIPFDIIPPASALDAFWSSVSSEFVEGLYSESGGAPAAGDLPAVTAEAVAAELGLDRVAPKNLDRLRRAFAFKNHPDRVAPELRERALIRMALANRLIDEAKRSKTVKAKA
jgi:hypothetical protein